jgi:membrane protease YdiL (CAAX protease family)
VTSVEANPAHPTFGASESPSERKLWRSPIATLPLWPVLLVSAILLFVLTPSVPVTAGHWRGIESLAPFGVPLGWWWVSARRRGYSTRDVLGQRPSRKDLALILVATLAAMGLQFGWLASLSALDFIPESWERAKSPLETASTPIQLARLVVVAPCAEEILFRGLIFRRSLRWMRPIPAALWSSLFFGICHLDTVGSGLFALVMVGLYLQSGSLWVPIAAHSLNNAIVAALARMEALNDAGSSLVWALAAAQLVCVPWVAWFLFRTLRQLRQLRQLEGFSP